MYNYILGEILDNQAFSNAHNSKKVLGVFWYDISTKMLDLIQNENISHNQRDRFKIFKKIKNQVGLIAGRAYKNKDYIYLLIYNTDVRGKIIHLSENLIQDLVWKVEGKIKKQVDFVIDGYGKNLLESKIKGE